MKVIKEMKKLLILSALFFPLNIFGEWVIQTSDIDRTLNDVCFVDTLHGWIAGGGTILRTTNGGKNWEKISVEQKYATVFTTIEFVDTLEGWVGGYQCFEAWEGGDFYYPCSVPILLHTVDGGNTWQNKQKWQSKEITNYYTMPISFDEKRIYDMCIVNSTCGFYMLNWRYNDSAFFHQWIELNSLNGIHYWEKAGVYRGIAICFLDSLRGWLFMFDEFHCLCLFYTEEGIENLSVIYEFSIPVDKRNGDMDFVDNSNGWIVADTNIVYHTADGGTTWVEQASGVTSNLCTIDFLDSLNGWAAGTNGVIIRTRDGGNNWMNEMIAPTSSTIRSLCVIDTSNVWAVGDDGVILCSNPNFGTEEVTPNFDENLLKIQPNPCFSSTDIKYRVPQKSGVKLRIYNLSGQLIKVLVNEHKPSGSYSITYKPPQAGIYFCQIEVNKVIETKKLTFVR